MEGCCQTLNRRLLLFPHIFTTIIHLSLLMLPSVTATPPPPPVKRFHFNVEWKTMTKVCYRKPVLTVNGKFPGPTISVNEGDNVQILVTNSISANTTLHWHGVKQMRTGWADGPAYVTQCPIAPSRSYTYNFTVLDQRGTLWWHAHFSWQRASVYGAFIIHPCPHSPSPPPLLPNPYPNPIIHLPRPIIFGEWWNRDVQRIEPEMMLYGGGPNSSDAYTINGYPGPLYPCSSSYKHTFIQTVQPGHTYLLRIINAALMDEFFFSIDNHNLTVVEIDAVYTKPFTTSAILIAPGQTTNVLLTTHPSNSNPNPNPTFIMAARPYLTSVFPFDNSTTIGFLKYKTSTNTNIARAIPPPPYTLPRNLPTMKDHAFAAQFSSSLKSLASSDYPCNVPKRIDKRVVATVGLNLQDCPVNRKCQGFRGKRFFASISNQSFIRPSLAMLQSHYHKLNAGFSTDFPDNPPNVFNYTGVDPVSENMNTEFGARAMKVAFGTRLEIVLQDTNFLNPENHPIHFHGHNVFVVGTGMGNFDVSKDPKNYNLEDPPERNTVLVPMGGWVAIRLLADNPGVWFIHCHLEGHTSWGLASALIVENGKGREECVEPPPADLPAC